MSIIERYNVKDLEKVSVQLMNILYVSDWTEDTNEFSDDFIIKRINSFHERILKDLDVKLSKTNGAELFTILFRLNEIESVLFGETSEQIPDIIGVKDCIKKTELICNRLSVNDASWCNIQ